MKISEFLLIYFCAVNIFASIITCLDKLFAKKGTRRISEDFLMTTGLIGGALLEFLTMKIIRHKTRHKKFMIGLPVMFIIQAITAVLVYFLN